MIDIMKKLIGIIILILILSVVVVGCGGGHKSETTVSQQTAEKEFCRTLPKACRIN